MEDETEHTRYDWTDLETSYDCQAIHSRVPIPGGLSWWCGYIAVPKGHILHGMDYQDDKFPDIQTPGGITFSGHQDGDSDTWYLGFDCAHADDFDFDALAAGSIQTKKSIDLDYVKRQCAHLAAQVLALTPRKLTRAWLCWQLVPSKDPNVLDATPSAFLPVGTELVRVHYLSRDGWCAQVWGATGLGDVYYGKENPLDPEPK